MPFELPPPVTPSPSFRPWLRTSTERLAIAEQAVVGSVDEVLTRYQLSSASSWEVFTAQRQILWTFPLLDPHAGRRQFEGVPQVEYSGAIYSPALGAAADWPSHAGPRIFGYLRLEPARLVELIAALSTVDAAFSLVVPDLIDEQVASLAAANVQLSNHPVNLAGAFADCSAVLTYGAHGTVCASLLAGRPLVLVAEQMADVALSHRVARSGAAVLPDPTSPSAIASACQQVLVEPRYRTAAANFRDRYPGYDVSLQTRRLAELLHSMVALDEPETPRTM